MNQVLPKGWFDTKLGSIIDYGKAAKKTLSDVESNSWILELEDIEKDSSKLLKFVTASERPFKSTKNTFKKGDVLYGKLRPYLNKVIVALENGVCTTEIIPINSEPYCLNKYMFYWLKCSKFLHYVDEVSHGVNMPRLGTSDGKSAPFRLAPLAEQKEIVTLLDKHLAQVESTKARLDAIPAILKRFRQSVLSAAVSGKLTAEWRKSYPQKSAKFILSDLANKREIILNKEIELGNKEIKRSLSKIAKHKAELPSSELPKSWVWTSFMASMERVVDCHNKTAPYIDSGIPLIRTPDIRNGIISLKGAKYISQDTYDYWSRRCPPESGDIIFTREAPMGEAGIVPTKTVLCMGQRMMLLRPMNDFINSKYVFLNILSLNFQERMNKNAIGTGVKHLRVADVESLPYPLAPIDEQSEIVRRVEELFAYADRVEAQVNAAQQRVNNLTQSLLAKAFSGELTAKWRAQNPELITGKNSAAALLEKIKAERASLAGKKKSVKKTCKESKSLI
jgi:type I restriction enzyme S subunit